MNVTKEKLEEIFKVYEDKKNNNPNTIKTSEIGTHVTTQQNLSDPPDCSQPNRKSCSLKRGSIP
jgi:hypothetical protein